MYNRVRMVGRTLAITLALLTAGFQAQTAAASGAISKDGLDTAARVAGDDYRVDIDDVLKLSVLDVPELSGEFCVDNSGKLTLPVLSTPWKRAA